MKLLNIKRLIAGLIIALFATTASADCYYKAYEYAYKLYDYDTELWTEWSDWLSCNINVLVTDDDYLYIYSSKKQVYRATERVSEYYDDYGGKNIKFTAVDGSLKNCEIRVRSYKGTTQLYLNYKDAMWVYNITEK